MSALGAVEATEDEVQVARRLYLAGFVFLPWVWLLSAINFWPLRQDARIFPCKLVLLTDCCLLIGVF